ncbi:hypothetical protein M3Y95_00641100 [Aphelenchoides besseyi]|nr:hypothetical protein M3Y95_00641100 [Aphelenchoides besseyi]
MSNDNVLADEDPFNSSTLLVVHRINNIFATSLGLLLTSAVLFLIIYRTPATIRAYSRMILMSALTDLIYVLVDILCQSRIKMNKSAIFLIFSGPISMFSYEIQCFSTLFQASSAALACSVLPAQYIYRYYMIKRRQSPSLTLTTSLFLGSLIAALIDGALAANSFCYSAEKCRQDFDFNDKSPQLVSALCDPYSVVYLSWSTIVICGSYLTTLILSRLSVKALRQHASQFSGRTKMLQAQFTRTLAYQTVLPLFFSIIPMNIIVFTTFMNIDTGSLGTIMMSSISYIPFFNSFTTICCIKSYRQEVCGLFASLNFAKRSLTSVIPNSSGQTRGVSVTVN